MIWAVRGGEVRSSKAITASGHIRRLTLGWSILAGLAIACSSAQDTEPSENSREAVIADSEATGVFGQLGAFDTATFNKGGRSADSLAAPFAISLADDDSLFVADTNNSRVLHFPAGTTTADRVYGQGGDFSLGLENNGGVSADSLRFPQGVAYFAGAGAEPAGLFVADTQNHRVLFFDGDAITATRVIGQTDFSGTSPDVAVDRLNQPTGLAVSATGELYVADRGNHRVVRFPPGSSSADRVWGQLSFTTNVANYGGVGPTTLNGPAGVALDGSGSLFVADTVNRRVLRFPVSSATADAVWGQANFTSSASGVSANRFSYPQGVLSVPGEIWVSDSLNHRVLRFSTATSGSSATQVLGQLGAFDTGTSNKGGLSARSLRTPVGLGVSSDGTLFIADSSNHRSLSYAVSCATVGCDDGNPCTDDVCETSGTCSHQVAQTPPDLCLGFACDATTKHCKTTCSGSADCAATYECIAGRCTKSCAAPADCLGGTCSDGYCCDVACSGSCQACDVSGSEGTCSVAVVGTDPKDECLGYGCDGSGSCRSAQCSSDADCQSGFHCVGSVCTRDCSEDSECAGRRCVDGTCCGEDSCPSGATCNYDAAHAGSCIKALGSECTSASECGSGLCVDGVCCDSDCQGGCKSCKISGKRGTCSFIPEGLDPDDECPTDAPLCGGFCDGAGGCQLVSAGTECRQARCENGLLFEPAECVGDGSACPASASAPCPGAYGCELDGRRCRTTCTESFHCAPGATCSGGECRASGATQCTADAQCGSGFCVDGYCCNSRCDGECRSCALSGTEGVCSYVPTGQDPDQECGAGVCGAKCDGAGQCLGGSAGKRCAAATCAGSGVLLESSQCVDGSDECPARAQVSCGAGSCRNAACTLRCAAASDCADGAECSGGECRFPATDAGCGCRTRPASPRASWLLLGALVALRRRRRRA